MGVVQMSMCLLLFGLICEIEILVLHHHLQPAHVILGNDPP